MCQCFGFFSPPATTNQEYNLILRIKNMHRCKSTPSMYNNKSFSRRFHLDNFLSPKLPWLVCVDVISTYLLFPELLSCFSLAPLHFIFLVSGHGLACKKEISFILAKTLPILLDDRWIAHLAIARGSCVFNTRVHHVSSSGISADLICLSIYALRTDKLYFFLWS